MNYRPEVYDSSNVSCTIVIISPILVWLQIKPNFVYCKGEKT